VECFCFTDTTLAAGETMDMPVIFFVDPDIVDVPELKNVKTITLSYTMFPIDKEAPATTGSIDRSTVTTTNTEADVGG
jgi:cytochrome c oxidase assembly protein subunit 11